MQFTVSSAQLSSAVSYASKVIAPRPTQPVLGCVRLTVKDGHITLLGMGTAGEANASATLEAQVVSEGEVLLPGRLFAEVAAATPKGDVRVELDGSRVRVTAGKAKFVLPSMPLEDYPAPMPDAAEAAGTVATADLVAALDQVAIAASLDPSLPLLCAVHVVFDADRITFMATDRYRAAMRSIAWERAGKGPTTKVTLSAKVLHDVVRGLAKDGETLSVSFAEAGVVFAGETRVAKIIAIEGEYPAIEALYNATTTQQKAAVSFDSKEALATLSRVAIIGERNDPISLAFADELLKLSIGNADASGGEDELPITRSGEEMAVLFNPTYLQQGVAACGAGPLTMTVATPIKPVLLAPDDGTDFRYLVVPVRSRS